jgi:hypothetical protein
MRAPISTSASLHLRRCLPLLSSLGSSWNPRNTSSLAASMLSRTLRHSRSAPSLRALSPAPQGQIAHIHSSPSVAAPKSAASAPVGSPLAKGWRGKTVVELKGELKKRGLPTSGRKEEVRPILRALIPARHAIDQCRAYKCQLWDCRSF